MAPPSYSDLGKLARDIFNQAYHFGLWKLNCKTKTNSGIEFTTSGLSNQDSGKVIGSVGTKYTFSESGVTLLERWSTDNTLLTDLSVQDKFAEGLKLGAEFLFAPKSRNKSGKIKIGYGQENFMINSDFNIDLHGPLVNFAVVLGYQQWLGGYQTAFDTQNAKLTTNNFALGFTTDDFVFHLAVNDGERFSGSIFQRCSEKLDVAIQLACSSGGENTKFGIGCKYLLDGDANLRGKINNDGQIGMAYQQKLREGITVTLSALINGKNFNDGGHKIGIALELETVEAGG